ncbi:MAG: hypothetical protein KFF72_03550, partial [Arthrospira sp. SH-MAG29]
FAVADNIVPDHPRIRDRSVYLLVAIHPLPASEEGEFRNILLNCSDFPNSRLRRWVIPGNINPPPFLSQTSIINH